jgi:hypothetical protein
MNRTSKVARIIQRCMHRFAASIKQMSQAPTAYNTRGSSRVCMQAPTIDKLVGSLILRKNQQHIVNFLCRWYTLNPWRVQIGRCHGLFAEPRRTPERTSNDAFLFQVSSLGAAETRSRPTRDVFFWARHVYRLSVTTFLFSLPMTTRLISLFGVVFF